MDIDTDFVKWAINKKIVQNEKVNRIAIPILSVFGTIGILAGIAYIASKVLEMIVDAMVDSTGAPNYIILLVAIAAITFFILSMSNDVY